MEAIHKIVIRTTQTGSETEAGIMPGTVNLEIYKKNYKNKSGS